MSNRSRSDKKFLLFLILSVVVIAIGAVLFGVFGFAGTDGAGKSFEVSYDTVVVIGEKEEAVQKVCEDAFDAKGVDYLDKTVVDELDTTYFTETGNHMLRYTFDVEVEDSVLEALRESVQATLSGAEYADADISVVWHTLDGKAPFSDELWRGAIAVAVGTVAALIYVAFRFGIGNALAGLAFCAHDALLTAALFAVTRIPVASAAVLLYAALASLISLLLWTIHSAKMREKFKEPAFKALDAEEAVAQSYSLSAKTVLWIVCAFAAVLLIVGGIAVSGVRLYVYPALLPLAVCTYSSLVLSPGLYAPVKAAFDRRKLKHRRYIGKAKKEEET